jgi:hypothetical protein
LRKWRVPPNKPLQLTRAARGALQDRRNFLASTDL